MPLILAARAPSLRRTQACHPVCIPGGRPHPGRKPQPPRDRTPGSAGLPGQAGRRMDCRAPKRLAGSFVHRPRRKRVVRRRRLARGPTPCSVTAYSDVLPEESGMARNLGACDLASAAYKIGRQGTRPCTLSISTPGRSAFDFTRGRRPASPEGPWAARSGRRCSGA